jgi:Asp-tRNA(Asn)/Glu-tRNA(Gln) amidotransferase A subunit family amidase
LTLTQKRRAFGPFTAAFNASGNPAISLPLGQTSDGLPIGVQLVAARGREDLLIAVAAQLKQATPWRGGRRASRPAEPRTYDQCKGRSSPVGSLVAAFPATPFTCV